MLMAVRRARSSDVGGMVDAPGPKQKACLLLLIVLAAIGSGAACNAPAVYWRGRHHMRGV